MLRLFHWKTKKGVTINALQKCLDESDHKPHTTKESLLFLKDLSGL